MIHKRNYHYEAESSQLKSENNQRGTVKAHLNERLDLGTFMQLSFAHPLMHFAGIPVDTGNHSMSVLFLCGSIIVGTHDNGFPSCVPAAEDQHDFPDLHNLHHLGDLC